MNENAAPESAPDEPRTLADRRMEYRRAVLVESDVPADPFELFDRWFAEAVVVCRETGEEPHAMTLATSGSDGMPSARTVLLKGVDAGGFVWFTNYRSRKGRALEENPNAALVFRWGPLERQVGVRGPVTKVSAAESDAYFASRPLASRIGALASAQSDVIADRSVLEDASERLSATNPAQLARPEHWGGYRLIPREIEFWQGRPSRLHDRLRYRPVESNVGTDRWVIERLSP